MDKSTLMTHIRSYTTRKYVYLLICLILLMAVVTIGFLYWQSREFRKTELRANEYHLYTINNCVLIREEAWHIMFHIYEFLAQDKLKKKLIDGGQINLNVSFSLIKERMQKIKELHQHYKHQEYENVLKNAENIINMIFSVKDNVDFASIADVNEMAELLYTLLIRFEQLQRLHNIAYNEVMSNLLSKRLQAPRNIFIFLLSLGTLGFLIITRILKTIRSTEEELYKHRQHLQKLVEERTAKLNRTNEILRNEVTIRKRVEDELRARQKEIETVNTTLETRVHEEVEKSRQKDYIMIKQSRLVAMGEMIRFITHQWGQPLWALQLLFHNIEDSIDKSGLNQEDTNDLIADGFALVKRMFATMDDFKTFFQADKKKVTFSINKNIKDTLSLIGASFKHSNIPIILNEKEELMVSGFPNEFSQVILNILKNAKDTIIEKGIKGEIKIDFLRENDSAIVRIKDNGGGIPEEILDKIFDSYFTTKKEGKGTGIGLYLSKVIVEDRMKGQINVKNTKKGAEFEIILSIVQSS